PSTARTPRARRRGRRGGPRCRGGAAPPGHGRDRGRRFPPRGRPSRLGSLQRLPPRKALGMNGRNLTARVAHWSARHRKIAIFGWLGIFVVALGLTGSLGLNTLKAQDQNVRESGKADHLEANAGFYDRAHENVYIASRDGANVDARAFRTTVGDVTGTVRGLPHVRNVKSPLVAGNEGQISRDRTKVLVSFDIVGD